MSTAPPARRSVVAAIVRKDVRSFTRDRFWLTMSTVAVVWFAAIYYLLPDTVEETVRVGVQWTAAETAFAAAFAPREGLEWVRFDTRDELEAALGIVEADTGEPEGLVERARRALGLSEDDDDTAEDVAIGIAFPEDFLVNVLLTVPTTVTLYVAADVPVEIRQALALLVRESAYALTGHALPITPPAAETVVLGEDLTARQLALREKMKPLYAFLMLMMETFALAAIIADEVSSRTVTAVLATPARIGDVLVAKGIVGTSVAFAEAMVLMVLVRAFGENPLLLAVALLLGAVLVTGVAMLVGASGRDFIGMIFYSMLFLIPLIIPAMAELFPGTASAWVKVLPTYGLVQAIVAATSDGTTWSDVLPHLVSLAAWCGLTLAAGALVLRRKVATL